MSTYMRSKFYTTMCNRDEKRTRSQRWLTLLSTHEPYEKSSSLLKEWVSATEKKRILKKRDLIKGSSRFSNQLCHGCCCVLDKAQNHKWMKKNYMLSDGKIFVIKTPRMYQQSENFFLKIRKSLKNFKRNWKTLRW